MQRIAIYLDEGVDPSDLKQAFRQSRTPGWRVVTLLQEDLDAGHRPVLQELEHRLETGEFDRIAFLVKSPLRSQQPTRGM